MITRKARVTWRLPEEGGRTVTLPTVTRYVVPAKFPDPPFSSPLSEMFSMVMEFDPAPSEQGNPSIGTARLLFEEAPQEWLATAPGFSLFEGVREVARVELLDD